MRRWLFAPLCALGMVGLSGAVEMDLAFDVNGCVSFVETGASLETVIHRPGWTGAAHAVLSARGTDHPDVRFVDYRIGDGVSLTGRVSLVRRQDGAVALTTAVGAVCDAAFECLALTLDLPTDSFGGGAWRVSDGRSGALTAAWDGKTIGVFGGKVFWVELTHSTGESFRLTVPAGTRILIQDNRCWDVSSYSIRFFLTGETKLRKGDVRSLSCEISSTAGVRVVAERKTVVAEGENWVPLDYKKDIVAGSALDFSNQGLQDAPAGKYGWLRNTDGHFEFEGRTGFRQRFYGANLCYSACFPDKALADRLVMRLVRLGYNTVRIHHYEGTGGLFLKSNLVRGFDPEQAARLDYFLARCFANGIYVTTDLYTTRRVKWRDIAIDRDGDVPMSVYKNLIGVHEPAFENWCAFARLFFTHVNPHTGRAYRDEPGLPLVSLINEGKLGWCWTQIRSEEPMRKAWAAWLAERRAKDSDFAKGMDVDPTHVNSEENALFVHFMADVERKLVARQRAFLRGLGVKALLTNQNCGPHPAPMMSVKEDLYDYVDDHFYVDHPLFLGKNWSLPSRCNNKNPVCSTYLPYLSVAFTRLPTKPFCITEWNFSGPGMFRGCGGILTGAMAALQGWDGLWRFAYSHSRGDLSGDQGAPGYFDMATDPLGQASDRASVCLFLRGDLEPLAEAVADRLDRTDSLPADCREMGVAPAWKAAAWRTRVATALADVPGWRMFSLAETRACKEPPVKLSVNSAVDFNAARGSFRIMTSKTCGGFAPSGSLSAGAIAFDVGPVAATVWASSLDGKPVAKSKRILVTHLTDVQADGNVYANQDKTILLKWGRGRSVVRKGEAGVSLALADPGLFDVWALETSGRRLEKMPTRVENGRLCFKAAVKGPNGARMLYEVVRGR